MGRAGPALSAFSDTDSGSACPGSSPESLRVLLGGGRLLQASQGTCWQKNLKTGDPVPVLLPRGTPGHSFYISSSLSVHVKDPPLTWDTWRVSAPLGLSFPIGAALP